MGRSRQDGSDRGSRYEVWREGRLEDDGEKNGCIEGVSQTPKRVRIGFCPDVGGPSSLPPATSFPRHSPLAPRPASSTSFPRRPSLASRPAFNLSLGRPLSLRQPSLRPQGAAVSAYQPGYPHGTFVEKTGTASVEAETTRRNDTVIIPDSPPASLVQDNVEDLVSAATAPSFATTTTASVSRAMVLYQGGSVHHLAESPAASLTELVSHPIEGLDQSGIAIGQVDDTLAPTIAMTDAEPITHTDTRPARTPPGLYSVIMPTACALLRSDGALATLANLMRVSKAMYDASSEYLYRHLELTKRNIAGILWGLPYIPPHSLAAVILRGEPSAHSSQASYPAQSPAILKPPYAPWMHPRDSAPSTSSSNPSDIPTGASVSRKLALLTACKRLTIWDCPSAPDAATINANYSVHIECRGIFHGARVLRIAAGIHEEVSDYWLRTRQDHPFVHVLKGLSPKNGCIDTTPIWTQTDFQRSRVEDGELSDTGRGEEMKAALQESWERRPNSYCTWQSDSWKLDDKLLETMRNHHPYQSGLASSGSISCRHPVLFSAQQGELPLESHRKAWSGVASTIGFHLSSAFYGHGGHRPLPYYDIICPASPCELDSEETARVWKTALLADIEQHAWLEEKALPMAEAAKKITFLSPVNIPPCPCCGK